MRALGWILLWGVVSGACAGPGVILCLDALEAKCQKLLECDPEGFARAFGDQADVAQCVSQVEQDVAADGNPETLTCEEQDEAGELRGAKKRALAACIDILPTAECQDFLLDRLEECR